MSRSLSPGGERLIRDKADLGLRASQAQLAAVEETVKYPDLLQAQLTPSMINQAMGTRHLTCFKS